MVINEKIKKAMKMINKFNWLLIPKVASRLFISFTEEEKKTELNKPVALNSSESFENAKYRIVRTAALPVRQNAIIRLASEVAKIFITVP